MTFLPDRAKCAQREFVCGVRPQPSNLVSVESEIHLNVRLQQQPTYLR